jgi:hypothetical protein
VVTNARAFYTTRAAAGALAPGIPHALFGRSYLHSFGRSAPRALYACLEAVIASAAKQSSFLFAAPWNASLRSQ